MYISGWLQDEFPPMSKLFEIYTAFAFFSSWYSLGDTLLERSQEINLSFIEQPLSSWKCRNDAVDAEQHSNSQSNKEYIYVRVCASIYRSTSPALTVITWGVKLAPMENAKCSPTKCNLVNQNLSRNPKPCLGMVQLYPKQKQCR